MLSFLSPTCVLLCAIVSHGLAMPTVFNLGARDSTVETESLAVRQSKGIDFSRLYGGTRATGRFLGELSKPGNAIGGDTRSDLEKFLHGQTNIIDERDGENRDRPWEGPNGNSYISTRQLASQTNQLGLYVRPVPGVSMTIKTLYNAVAALRDIPESTNVGVFTFLPTQKNNYFTFDVFEGEAHIAQAVLTHCERGVDKDCFVPFGGPPGDFFNPWVV